MQPGESSMIIEKAGVGVAPGVDLGQAGKRFSSFG
jgi:hypothetical protein